ncbi:TPA: 2-amino-4-hydroxy-6-hydroxymethyldihydropteridine diphosphokinase [Candidatus Woesearchaeota archaeon]|nr:2-amino-4-hydroxy-6-hydroxymethyldihydropteridine diphosphokinase [archaeon]HIJ10420.1 2-amino-4-hydroxy-6-hydroxymethyldihydropteridine diphosphokinase [Candidatus Woesearchaeota archaeon]|tara:strand:- start:910 stop:1380 length:471 start_codon:yes stop_codon:yes gene_type:complete
MIILSIGSNINASENITKALSLLSTKFTITTQSSFYKTEPVGYENQEWFLNMVVVIETDLDPHSLLETLQEIETELGRERTTQNGPRTCDLDILLYKSKIIKENNLTIPHPRLHERNFVLVPLAEIAPNIRHPVFQKSITQLQEECKDTKEVHKTL